LSCAAACAVGEEPGADGRDALADLEAWSGARWRGVFRERTGELTLIARDGRGPDPEAASGDAERTARLFLASSPRLFGPAAHEPSLALRSIVPDDLGGTRLRFELRVDGLRVEGGETLVVLDGLGRVRAASGTFPRVDHVEASPTVLEDDAIAAARARIADAIGAIGATAHLDEPAELAAKLVDGRLLPIWRVVLAAEDPTAARPVIRREIQVDATSGAILGERDLMRSTAATGSGLGVFGARRPLEIDRRSDGTYALRDTTRTPEGLRTFTASGRERLPGRLVRSAVDAHANGGIVLAHLAELGRRSLDDDGGGLRLVVHYGEEYPNAFWDGRRAVFGDGDPTIAPLSAALDIVAHELVHAVTDHDAGFVYAGESGAVSESLSDVFACFVELDHGDGDWTIGEDVTTPPLRDLAQPAFSGQPAHMLEWVDLPMTEAGDWGGVHVNSTIPSHAAYLLAEGGRNAVSGVTVPRLGRGTTERIWYRAASVYLTPYSGFDELAEATRAAAEDLYGPSSCEVEAVETAWRAVGVWR
jgi:Zn-dependent metalloprotease